MNISELLKPRYKVENPDTSGRWAVGDIYTFTREVAQTYDYWVNQKGQSVSFNFFSAFPHLFRKLNWYEDREESQMPEYVKWDDHSYMYPQQRVSKISAAPFSSDGFTASNILPATLEEYNQYISQGDINKK